LREQVGIPFHKLYFPSIKGDRVLVGPQDESYSRPEDAIPAEFSLHDGAPGVVNFLYFVGRPFFPVAFHGEILREAGRHKKQPSKYESHEITLEPAEAPDNPWSSAMTFRWRRQGARLLLQPDVAGCGLGCVTKAKVTMAGTECVPIVARGN